MPNGNPFLEAFDDLEIDSPSPFSIASPDTTDNNIQTLGLSSGNPFLDAFARESGQIQAQKEEQDDGATKAIKFLAEASGIPAVARSALSLLPDQISDPIRREFQEATGLSVHEAGVSDFIVAGITLLGGAGVRGAMKLVGGVARGAFKPLLEASPTAVKAAIGGVAKTGGPGATSIAAVEREFAERALPLSLDDAQRAIRTAIDLQKSGKDVLSSPAIAEINERLFKKLGKAYELGDIDVDIIPRLMRDLGIDSSQEGAIAFARLFEAAASESGRTLKLLSDFKKAMGRVLKESDLDKQLDDIFVEQGVSRVLDAKGFSHFTNVWRASITGQLATAVRNFEVSAGLLTPIRFFDDIFSASVARFSKVTGVPATGKGAIENFMALGRTLGAGAKKGKGVALLSRRADEIEKALQKVDVTEAARLFGTPVMDVTEGGLKGTTGRIVNFLQIMNRTQEKIARGIIFDAEFAKRMAVIGVDPTDVWRGGLGAFDGGTQKAIMNALQTSVQNALELTFAGAPKSGLARWMIDTYRRFPAAALVHPFPRFLANSLKFLKDHSPLGVARFMTEGQRRAVVRGIASKGAFRLEEQIAGEAVEAIGKTMTGYVMLAGAMAIRNSELAGERWYEIRVGDRTVDLRPFNPLAAYMLFAEQMRKMSDPLAGGPDLKVKDFADALAGIRRLTGTGLFLFENFSASVEGFELDVKRTAGEFLGGFTVPFRTFKDFISTVDNDEGIYRADDDFGLLGPAISNLPLLSRALPPEPRATREGVLGEEEPIGPFATPTFRQLTGVIARSRTPAEEALINLDINPRPTTGDPELDRSIQELAGPLIDRRIGAIVSTPGFARLDRVDQRELLSRELSRIKRVAKQAALQRNLRDIVDRVIEEIDDLPRERQREELRKMRNAGRINAALEGAILRLLQRRA